MILSIVSILVVFACLIILWGIYSLLGALLCGKISLPRKSAHPADEAEVAAAIATALELYLTEQEERPKSIITIRPRSGGAWTDKSLTLRKSPTR